MNWIRTSNIPFIDHGNWGKGPLWRRPNSMLFLATSAICRNSVIFFCTTWHLANNSANSVLFCWKYQKQKKCQILWLSANSVIISDSVINHPKFHSCRHILFYRILFRHILWYCWIVLGYRTLYLIFFLKKFKRMVCLKNASFCKSWH